MPEATIAQLLRTRLLVAALGERVSEPWWQSQFLTTTGVSYGKRLFPRGYGAAALSSVTVAASRDHDANTGKHSFHLFRMPAHIEHQLSEAARQHTDWELPTEADAIIDLLDAVEPRAATKFSAGPKTLGSVSELKNTSISGKLASLYAEAARKKKRVYPYFEAGSNG